MRHRMQERISRLNLLTMITLGLIMGLLVVAALRSSVRPAPSPPEPKGTSLAENPPTPTVRPSPTLLPTSTPVPTPTSPPRQVIGLLAGHWQYDSGAICDDGLREVDITLAVAQRVAALLRARGYEVDILPEADESTVPWRGYRALAFVALHADSCDIPGASGFKVTRSTFSVIPAVEDRLVQCLYTAYQRATGLPPHKESITWDMLNYYALRQIAPSTPGAIIEMGFMLDDRAVLIDRQYEVALGVANGILCFLESEGSR
ncbi:MAG: N-acetylmuramoyl-L-alanine amidase [Anaerolineae bacterium]